MSLIEGALNRFYLVAMTCCFFTSPVDSAQYSDKVINQLRPLLNSQRIEKIFGSYGVDILYQGDELRVTSLYSLQNQNKTIHTYAIVNYKQPLDKMVNSAHKEILSGGSIGAVLKKKGFIITKEPIYFGEIELPLSAKIKMQTSAKLAAVHIYRLKVSNASKELEVDYCTITEIYSPDYINNQTLSRLYPSEYHQYNQKTDKASPFLAQIGRLDIFLSKHLNGPARTPNRTVDMQEKMKTPI